MTNKQYIEKIVTSADRILVDTSTLMTKGFHQFINKNKPLLNAGEKKIIVPKAVYTELARHMESDDATKSELAMDAVELMALNRDIFIVESAPLTNEEIAHAFADAQLLSELTLHRSDYNQLLITNDRKLSCDAFELNSQQSCKGHRVLVCYINWYGELQCCECARACSESAECETKTEIDESKTEAGKETYISTQPLTAESRWKFDWRSGLVSISGVGILYGLYKGGKTILRNIA